MSIEINNDNNVLLETAKPAAIGGLPTAFVTITKAPMPLRLKATALAATSIAAGIIGIKSPPHQHPKRFLHPELGTPLKKGDIIEHNGKEKVVLGYTGHHKTVFQKHSLNESEIHMREKDLWTGPYQLVAGNYGAGKNKQVGLVLADKENFHNIDKHDVSRDGPFCSIDASLAVAITPQGQIEHDIVVVKPTELKTKHIPSTVGTIKRLHESFKENGVKSLVDGRTVTTLQDICNKMHPDHNINHC